MTESNLEVVFSRLKPEHVEEVVRLEKECHLNSRGGDSYLKLIQSEDSILIVALISTSASPIQSVIGAFSGWIVVDELQIDNICLDANWRQKGIGRMLLLNALDEARRKGALQAFLEVRSSNRAARALYEKSGFAVVGRRPAYYQNPTDDALLMSLELVVQH